MKQFFILLLTFLSAITLGQNAKKEDKVSIGYSLSPDYSFRTLKNGDGNNFTDFAIKSRENIGKAKFGYTKD